jgi:hypothetical protein
MWVAYGEKLNETITDGSFDVAQSAIFNKNIALEACKTWLVFYGNPTFTDLKMRVYNQNDVLVYESSNAMTKLEVLPENTNAYREIYFKFDKANFKSNDTYKFRLVANGYTYSDASHISWSHNYPDPVYRTNVNASYESLLVSPYYIYFIGSEI